VGGGGEAGPSTKRQRRIQRVSRKRTTTHGFTLIEVAVVAVVTTIIVLIAFSGMQQWSRNRSGKVLARQFSDLLLRSRAEAMSSKQPTIVFFASDPSGQPLLDGTGEPVAALAIRDLDGDGQMDDDERLDHVANPAPGSISWGHANASEPARGDPAGVTGTPPVATMTFDRPDGTDATWVAFLPDGTPRAYVENTTVGIGAVGSGAGAVYLTSGSRDFAVVLSPLGTAHVQTWDDGAERWKR